MSKTVLIASDHRGVTLKAQLVTWLQAHSYVPQDLGTNSTDRCDAGDFAAKLAKEITAGKASFGVLICGTGQAMAMTANRYRTIRAALCAEVTTARLTRQHNDANVLVLGADIIGSAIAEDCLQTFLTTEFLGGRYAERRDKLTALGGI
jgi:ribose 5-phosphate isomerase B